MTPRENALKTLARLIGDGRRDNADPEVTALACLTALEHADWHHMPTRAEVNWRVKTPGSEPGEDYRAALEEVRRKAAQSARELGHDEPGAA